LVKNGLTEKEYTAEEMRERISDSITSGDSIQSSSAGVWLKKRILPIYGSPYFTPLIKIRDYYKTEVKL